MPRERILILGGTRDARQIAEALLGEGYAVISSLAGVTETPVLPPGEVRRGGFGGIAGLADYLVAENIALVIDATHPFAAQMSAHAHAACGLKEVPLLRFERPAWDAVAGDRWMEAKDIEGAVGLLPAGARALVTIGRKEIAPFFARGDISGVARMIEAPAMAVPPGWEVLLERPPFTVESEARLMAGLGITHLVTKNAGGSSTGAKLVAARQLSLPVIMVRRPVKPGNHAFSCESELIRAVSRVLYP
jgi:precorrin-6A/cobalt-precorrin-6A reductase